MSFTAGVAIQKSAKSSVLSLLIYKGLYYTAFFPMDIRRFLIVAELIYCTLLEQLDWARQDAGWVQPQLWPSFALPEWCCWVSPDKPRSFWSTFALWAKGEGSSDQHHVVPHASCKCKSIDGGFLKADTLLLVWNRIKLIGD